MGYSHFLDWFLFLATCLFLLLFCVCLSVFHFVSDSLFELLAPTLRNVLFWFCAADQVRRRHKKRVAFMGLILNKCAVFCVFLM
ncbi:hypothetical protein EBS43_11855 [bacterium]|nr:hypothetical protein [bacterium]